MVWTHSHSHPHCAAGPGAHRRCPAYSRWHWQRSCFHKCIWFFFGAAATGVWYRHKERSKEWEAWKSSRHKHCIRSNIKPLPWQQPAEQSYAHEWAKTINNIPIDADCDGPSPFTKEETRHMKEFGRKIEGHSVDLCERALDCIAKVAEDWKTKLSHYRAERKKEIDEETKES